jgi:hypothetical protein
MQPFLQSLKLDVASGQEGGCPEPFKILSLERRLLVCGHEGLIGVSPRATSVALTAVFQKIHLAFRLSRIAALSVVLHESPGPDCDLISGRRLIKLPE